jgi:glycosyltransferase involved in cell wall biosynthesis
MPPVQVGPTIRVRMIAGCGEGATGISRYASQLCLALTGMGVGVETRAPFGAPLPPLLVSLARRAGYDLDAFFSTYPVGVPAPRGPLVAHLTSQQQASALALARRTLRHAVVTVHDLITLAHRAEPELTGYMTWYDRIFDGLTARGLRRARALIADSRYTASEIERVLGSEAAARVTAVPLGVDHGTFFPASVGEAFWTRVHLTPGRPYVLYVGSEDPRKNLHGLLTAFRELLRDVPDAVLLKVGAPRFRAERATLLADVDRLGLAGRVRFFDRVADADLADFYRAATVFAFPSLYEGFGLPVLEAMASGTPVVCSHATSLPEVAGDAALLVDPVRPDALADALRAALTDEPLRATLRDRGTTRAAQFTWERTARETLAVYAQVLDTS